MHFWSHRVAPPSRAPHLPKMSESLNICEIKELDLVEIRAKLPLLQLFKVNSVEKTAKF